MAATIALLLVWVFVISELVVGMDHVRHQLVSNGDTQRLHLLDADRTGGIEAINDVGGCVVLGLERRGQSVVVRCGGESGEPLLLLWKDDATIALGFDENGRPAIIAKDSEGRVAFEIR